MLNVETSRFNMTSDLATKINIDESLDKEYVLTPLALISATSGDSNSSFIIAATGAFDSLNPCLL